jgi:hypothetical protein
MAAQKKKRSGTRTTRTRSMPSTTGAKPSGAHSYGDSTMKRSTPMINPANKGDFTAKAKAAGMSVQAYAAKVVANPSNYPTATVKQANFAKNIGGAAKGGK